MTAITFDTHAFVKRLEQSDFSEAQVEALAEAQKDSFAQALNATLATKGDIHRVEKEIYRVEKELLVIKWMLGIIIGGLVSLVLNAFFLG